MRDEWRASGEGGADAFTAATPRREAVAALRRLFEGGGLDTPALDARILATHALGITPLDFATTPDTPVGAAAAALSHVARRRLSREPVARILGRWEFYGLPFELGAATLVPRPDTETVVEAALKGIDRQARLRILDLGTGSGAILVALLHELPQAHGIGIDLSPTALTVAARNAAANGVGDRAVFAAGDWARPIAGTFDIVVSNPPYIAGAVIPTLDREVRDHDPLLALDGGDDGLAAYRAIVADVERLLAPGGRLVLEIGCDQADAVTALLAAAELPSRVETDLGGRPRAVVAARS